MNSYTVPVTRDLNKKPACSTLADVYLQDAIKVELNALMHHVMENIWNMNWLQR